MFEITQNGLKRKSDIKSLKLQNKDYDVIFFYYGDYERDCESGMCDVANLSMSCKVKGDALPIELMEGKLFIDASASDFIILEKAAEYQKRFETAYASACELAEIIKQYFGLDAVSI